MNFSCVKFCTVLILHIMIILRQKGRVKIENISDEIKNNTITNINSDSKYF